MASCQENKKRCLLCRRSLQRQCLFTLIFTFWFTVRQIDSPSSRKCVFILFPQFNNWAPLCRMTHVQNLRLKAVCTFITRSVHLRPLKILFLEAGPVSMICDITVWKPILVHYHTWSLSGNLKPSVHGGGGEKMFAVSFIVDFFYEVEGVCASWRILNW